MKLLTLLFFSLFLTATSNALAQHSDNPNYAHQLAVYQDSLKLLNFKMINEQVGPDRMDANYAFTHMLVRALKIPHSFNFPFDSLKAIGIVYSPDRKFRILSWNIMFDDGSYRFYGAIQMNDVDGKLKLFGLTDYSPAIKNPADTVTSAENWYGAQYYQVIPVNSSRIPHYILLGWKGNTVKTTKKVIEVLSFKNDKPVFGMAVFDGLKDDPKARRIIFEYSRQTSMTLSYQADTRTIVFDHLAPRDPKMKDKFEMYGPDMSYNGLRLIADRWKLLEDLPLKNPPVAKDEHYIKPVKAFPGKQ